MRQPDDRDDEPMPDELPGLPEIRVPATSFENADKSLLDELILAELDLDIRYAMRVGMVSGEEDVVYRSLSLQMVRNSRRMVTP